MVVRSLYEGLIGLKGGSTDEYEGLVAESWRANDDHSVWTFTLRDGLTFQNGNPCDADAVRASYERMLTLGKGAVEVFRRFVQDPKQMAVKDERTIEFDLGKPQPLFIAALASTYGPQIIDAKGAKAFADGDDWGNAYLQTNGSDGLGTGAYTVAQFEPGSSVVLKKYDGYWGGWEGPHFDQVVIRVVEEAATMRQLIESGAVDIIDRFSVQAEDIAAYQQNAKLHVDLSDSTEVEYFTMTVGGPLATPEARQALCTAFPYDDVISGVYKGYASRANTLIAPSVRGYDKNSHFFQTDVDAAKALLAKAGVAAGTKLTLAMGAGADTTSAELLQANLQKLGIDLEIQRLDQATFTGTFYGDTPAEERPNLMRWSWWPDYNDAWNVLYPTTSCDSWGSKGSNGGFYCNKEFDALLAQAKDASTEDIYDSVLAKAQAIIAEQDPPVICTAQPKWTTVLQNDIEGFVFNPINLGTYIFHNMSRKG
jgi:peptide/nickel transport system substrate-binding protein